MSFLNPVSEPVLHFKSTDAGAPKINYASRSAGDIKAVFKACLNTGYGSKAGAGWTIALESGNIIELSSPSTAMSDYKICLDDRAAASTTYYYKYKNVKTVPEYNVNNRVNNDTYGFDATGANGWQLIVTKQGMYFVEIFTSAYLNKQVARLTFFGRVKSALLIGDVGKNIGFWTIGAEAGGANYPGSFIDSSHYYHLRLSTETISISGSANSHSFVTAAARNKSAVAMVATWYLFSGIDRSLLAEQPGILLYDTTTIDNDIGVFDTTLDSRNILSVCVTSLFDSDKTEARVFLIRLDNWDY